MSNAFSEAQKLRMQDLQQEFHLEAAGARSWRLYPVYSSKHTFAEQVQPGQPSEVTWELDNPHAAQALQFIFQVSGGAPIGDLTLTIDDGGEVSIPTALQPGNIVRYAGGDQCTVYDKNWKELERVSVDASDLKVGSGKHAVRMGCRFQSVDQPQVKCEFRTIGEGETLAAKEGTR
jgi:hypothetical protein